MYLPQPWKIPNQSQPNQVANLTPQTVELKGGCAKSRKKTCHRQKVTSKCAESEEDGSSSSSPSAKKKGIVDWDSSRIPDSLMESHREDLDYVKMLGGNSIEKSLSFGLKNVSSFGLRFPVLEKGQKRVVCTYRPARLQ